MTIVIELPGQPLAWKAPYVGTRGAFSPRSQVMDYFRLLVRKQYVGPQICNPVRCEIDLYFKIPKSASKKNKILMLEGKLRPIGRPDLGNCSKLLYDVLNGIVYEDDAQIVESHEKKWYAENPRSVYKITPI